MAYNHYSQALQEPDEQYLDTVHLTRVTPTGREVPSVAEECAFQRRLDKPLTYSELRYCILQDYEFGCVDAKATMQRLKDNDLYGDPETFLKIFAAGVAALHKGGQQ